MQTWIDETRQKQEDLLAIVDKSIDKIKNSYLVPIVTEKSEPLKSQSKLPAYIMGVGFALLGVGAFLKKEDHTLLKVGLLSCGAILSFGGYIMTKKRVAKESIPQKEEVRYRDIEYDIYTNISAMNKTISNDWYEYLGVQNNSLASLILTLSIDSKVKTKMVDNSVKRSLISVSMIDFSSQLKDVGKKESFEAFDHFINDFREIYRKTIIEAVNKQLDTYQQIEQLYTHG